MLNVSWRFPSQRAPQPMLDTKTGRTVIDLRLVAVTVAGLLSLGNICLAQDGLQPAPARREFESRSELEEQAKAAEAQHRTGEAWLLKQRLEKGDFQDGDRILLKVQGNALAGSAFINFPETLTVRAGRKVELP